MSQPNKDLLAFLRATAATLAAEYDRIHARALEDPGTAGDQGEENWATLLREWLPSTYHIVTKGRILSHDGAASPQVDVIVLSPRYPRVLLDKKLYLAGGVLAAFECKITLLAAHLREAVEAAAIVKRAAPVRYGSPYRELHTPILFGLLAHAHAWKSPPSELNERIILATRDADAELVRHPRETLDVVCVANLGTWRAVKAAWNGRSTMGVDAASREAWDNGLSKIFGEHGSASTSVVGAVNPDSGQAGDPDFTPVGAMLTYLLRRLAWEDTRLRPLAAYFRLARLEGGGPGLLRLWPSSIYSEPIREAVVAGEHLQVGKGKQWDEDDTWNEWGNYFH